MFSARSVVISLIAPVAVAEDKIADVTDMQVLRAAVKSDKKAFVASTMKLTGAEAKKFWPIYDAYQRTVDVSNQRRALAIEAVIAKDESLSSLYARNLANELIANDEAEIRARFSEKHEGEDRNSWLYSYNPLTVELR